MTKKIVKTKCSQFSNFTFLHLEFLVLGPFIDPSFYGEVFLLAWHFIKFKYFIAVSFLYKIMS
jgi:hypothetical protein